MKRRLCLALIGLLLITAFAIPVIAEPLGGNHEEIRVIYTPVQVRWQAQLTCKHTNSRLLHYPSDNRFYSLCLDCDMITDVDRNKLSATELASVQTVNRIQEDCPHLNKTAWSFYNQYACRCICEDCDEYIYQSHTIVPASCTSDQYCSSCGGTYETWPLHYGHHMGYHCPNLFYDTTHQWRCIRRDNDDQFTCDYVNYTANCDFDRIVDPAVDGYHDIWGMCFCGNATFTGTTKCSAPRACGLCSEAANSRAIFRWPIVNQH